jgi:hypothetical protein
MCKCTITHLYIFHYIGIGITPILSLMHSFAGKKRVNVGKLIILSAMTFPIFFLRKCLTSALLLSMDVP